MADVNDISEPDRGRRLEAAAGGSRPPANRRRIRGERGRRSCGVAESCWSGRLHVCETGGMRRVHLRGHPNIRKRLLVHVAGQPRAACGT